ncbi:MAG: ParB/RepB/Spo0J family partition protein [Bacilli bacterium]|nr:ParB/RepB/Spo0J family partition protein [Bacilli bacterium]
MKKETKNRLLKEELTSLISKYSQTNVLEELAKTHHKSPVQMIKTELIMDNAFVRKVTLSPNKLAEFVDNYQRNILLEPLVVRAKDEKYEVIIGRKRLAAAKLAKISEIPVIVMNYNDEETLLILLAKARDSQRSNVLEFAYIFHNLNKKYGYLHENLAKMTYSSRTQVTNILRLLKLPTEILKALNNDEISFGHARALVSLSNEEALEHLNLIITNKLSVRQLEAMISKPSKIAFKGQEHIVLQTKNKVTIVFSSEEEAKEFVAKSLKK